MPEGQFTGSRQAYTYTMDDGNDIVICLDQTLGSVAGNGLTALTSAANLPGKPQRFSPRVVFWQGTLNGKIKRKQLVCNVGSSLYGNSGSSNLTVDGVAGVVTGRRGEQQSFICSLPASTP